MESVTVAAVQAAPVLLDRDATIGKVLALAGQAAGAGARLVAFPEAFIPGYPDWVWRTRPWDANATALYTRFFDQAVVVGSAATDLLAETAGRLGSGTCSATPWGLKKPELSMSRLEARDDYRTAARRP